MNKESKGLPGSISTSAAVWDQSLDWLMTDALIADGTGAEISTASVGVKDGVIAYIGSGSPPARQVIDCRGLVLSPGFIDTHSHSEFTLIADGRAEGKLCQGVTTEINGNCGLSAAPLLGEAATRREPDHREYGIQERWSDFDRYFAIMQQKGIALNSATLCGQGNIRGSVMGYRDMKSDPAQRSAMRSHFSEALHAGCRGLSTGLIYPPGVFTPAEEIIDLMKSAAAESRGALYATHMRSEGERLVESVEEALGIGREAGAAVHLSHLKTSGEENWSKIDRVIELIANARSEGMQVTADRYPYIASSTDLDTILPAWVCEGGTDDELKRIRNAEIREGLLQVLSQRSEAYWQGVLISSVPGSRNKWMEGMSIASISERTALNPAEAALRIIEDEEARAGAIFFTMSEENLKNFLRLPYMMIGSDSAVRSFSGITRGGKPHPRGFGSFPRFLSVYVRDAGLMTLPEAVRRMTLLPAEVFGLGRRGMIREGWHADITLFDYQALKDSATFDDPFQRPEGIVHVMVNGILALRHGDPTGERGGRIL